MKIKTKNVRELPWLAVARANLGLAEIAGKQHHPVILRWLHGLKAWWNDDETPWCGTFVAHCLRESGRGVPQHWYRAKAWLNAGTLLNRPAYGCLAVFERSGGGHVGFVVGEDDDGNLWILGGNQGNRVSVARFNRDRLLGLVWPAQNGVLRSPEPFRFNLPKWNDGTGFSQNEA